MALAALSLLDLGNDSLQHSSNTFLRSCGPHALPASRPPSGPLSHLEDRRHCEASVIRATIAADLNTTDSSKSVCYIFLFFSYPDMSIGRKHLHQMGSPSNFLL